MVQPHTLNQITTLHVSQSYNLIRFTNLQPHTFHKVTTSYVLQTYNLIRFTKLQPHRSVFQKFCL